MEPNKLAQESSLYLQQHATNPVNWYPWGEYAIQLARHQDKPILLSIGYSACHWCHVMMHESFVDPDVSATMNRLFINIKVDKEERPDLDKIYQTAYQLLMGQAGGWPLTMFLSPHTLIPYYGGTYFPKDAIEEQNIPDFASLLHKLNDVYYHEKEKIKYQDMQISAVLQIINLPKAASELPTAAELRAQAVTILQREFDPVNGGFGEDAKFPNCPVLEFLLQSTDSLTRHIALTTLETMAQSGLYDHLAGGFFRYTVDKEWHIPHFEKMLYDNAQLLNIYAQAYKLTNHKLYRQIINETVAWLTHNMQDESGGFYASIDADSEEQEGLYYVWDIKEIKKILNATEFHAIESYFNLNHKANFNDKWHLYINNKANAPSDAHLAVIKEKLLAARAEKIPPALDRKILTAWNGLAIKGLAKSGFINLAENVVECIINNLMLENKLYASLQNGTQKTLAFLDDYAFVLDGVLTIVNNNQQHKYLPFCKQLADTLVNDFYDTEHGGFFFTSHYAEKLFYRPKTFTDDALPSGNGIACLALLKLAKLLGNERYLEVVKKSVSCAQAYINEAPELHTSMLAAYELLHS